MRKYVLYGAGLIALYILVANYRGAAAVEGATASGGTNLVKAFQGR